MKLGTLSDFKKQTVKEKETVPTKSEAHGSDGSKVLDPPVVPKGSAGTSCEQKVLKTDRTEFVRVTRKPSTSITNNKQKPILNLPSVRQR